MILETCLSEIHLLEIHLLVGWQLKFQLPLLLLWHSHQQFLLGTITLGIVVFEEDIVFLFFMLFSFLYGICESGVCLLVEFFNMYFHYLQPSFPRSFSSDACNIQEKTKKELVWSVIFLCDTTVYCLTIFLLIYNFCWSFWKMGNFACVCRTNLNSNLVPSLNLHVLLKSGRRCRISCMPMFFTVFSDDLAS